MDTQNKKSYSFSVQQSQNSENEHTAIVSVSLCDGTMTVSNFGSANQATVNSYNTVDIINAARNDAQAKIQDQMISCRLKQHVIQQYLQVRKILHIQLIAIPVQQRYHLLRINMEVGANWLVRNRKIL